MAPASVTGEDTVYLVFAFVIMVCLLYVLAAGLLA